MQASALLSPSPSLSSYSTGKLAEIAARVVDELGLDSDPFCFDAMNFGGASTEHSQPPGEEAGGEESDSTQFDNEDVEEEEEEEEEEFAFVCDGPGMSPISADEIFYNGQIRPAYPVFNRDLLLNGVSRREKDEDDSKKTTKLRLPLKKLLSEDREWTSSSSSSSSSSESDELDGLAPGSYCVWRPKPSRDQPSAAAAAATKRCWKSSSTGSSKRWRFKDLLLNRSNGGSKDTFLLVAPSKKRDNKIGESKRVVAVAEDDDGGGGVVVTARDGGKTAGNDEDKRKPLPPQRAGLVGFLATANGLSRNLNLHPF
ncbi:uncharacterized protein LOC115741623 [Rhodamnia argentea]|uniref:Uncharacterized protein LOC115741623 n=1 Tax=Rhodamnia argentea TaxID=178133 RepID=A0A8B8P9W8_9MYRT|nr:uncharacterized protein LOC115741623 [Rhodamnia argentea]